MSTQCLSRSLCSLPNASSFNRNVYNHTYSYIYARWSFRKYPFRRMQRRDIRLPRKLGAFTRKCTSRKSRVASPRSPADGRQPLAPLPTCPGMCRARHPTTSGARASAHQRRRFSLGEAPGGGASRSGDAERGRSCVVPHRDAAVDSPRGRSLARLARLARVYTLTARNQLMDPAARGLVESSCHHR